MARSGNPVPVPATSFVGRSSEIAALLQYLSPESGTRLVTVTGPGGVGKTRLVLEVARILGEQYADGVWFVEMATMTSAAQIAPALADVLGIEHRPGVDVLAAIGQFIASRELMLLFDNCEHLIDDLAIVFNTLLLRTPNLRILCTSREAVHLPGEQRIMLEPMSAPWLDEHADTAVLLNADVIRLFAERAMSVAPGFRLSALNVADVASICRAVDGIPLAVELAAAQVRVSTPQEIAQRLQGDLAFLNNGRAGETRHRTLEEAIAWSERLLAPDERLLFQRLAIFAQSATLAAIEAVCADQVLPRTTILGVLTHLVDKSLVLTQPVGNQMRYMMMGTIRRYALERLARSDERDVLARRHAQWAWNLAHEGGGGICTRDSVQWVGRAEAEYENLRQAIAFGIEHDPDLAVEIVSNLAWYWLWRNHVPDALQWTSAILEHPAAADSDHVRARALYTNAMAAVWAGDYEGARERLEEALALARATDDQELMPHVLRNYALAAIYCGQLDLATQILDQLDNGSFDRENALHIDARFSLRGIIERDLGNIEHALVIMEEGLRRLRAYGEPFLLSAHLFEVARTHQVQGNNARAETLYRECHELTLRTQNAPLLTRTFFVMAEVSQAAGNLREALDWYEAGLEHLSGQGEDATAATLRSLAHIAGGAGMWALCVSLYAAAEIPWPLGKALSAIIDTPYRRQIEYAYSILGDADLDRARRAGDYWSVADALGHGISVLRTSLIAGHHAAHPELQIRMLGQGQVLIDDRFLEMSDWKYAAARDLLFYLVAIGERTREQIVNDFWPDVDAARARNRLNVTVHFLRKAMGARRWIVFEDHRYRFDPVGPYSYDVDDFYSATALASRISQKQPDQAIASLEYAVSLVRGPFLSDVADGDWHKALRDAIHRDYQDTLVHLANLQIDHDLAQSAVYTLSLALQLAPFAEETYRCLMRAHLVRRDLVQVMQVYRHLCELLEEEYGAPPSAATIGLYEEIVRTLRDESARDARSSAAGANANVNPYAQQRHHY